MLPTMFFDVFHGYGGVNLSRFSHILSTHLSQAGWRGSWPGKFHHSLFGIYPLGKFDRICLQYNWVRTAFMFPSPYSQEYDS
jgi:hypothetical protein